MPYIIDEATQIARGGTELQSIELQKRLSADLLSKFQIIPSRVVELDPHRKRILWLHDLADDQMNSHLANGGYNKFEKLVFVSNWQMQRFIERFSIPWYKCAVIQNAINPLKLYSHNSEKIKLIYHTTPHRGLNILLSVFDQLLDRHPEIELDVFSSFKIYGWEQRNEQYQNLFDFCIKHPNINYHGTVSNDVVKEAVSSADIFAFPSTWVETSCISLLEAMSAGLICVHPNLGALPETAANWTLQYQYQENERDHAKVFFNQMELAISNVRNESYRNYLDNQSAYINTFYNWDLRASQWEAMLRSI